MGLRYLAYVGQADTLHDALTDTVLPLECEFEMQIFQTVAEATAWLRACAAHAPISAAAQAAETAGAARAS